MANGAAALAHFAQYRFALMRVAHAQFAATPGAIFLRAIKQQAIKRFRNQQRARLRPGGQMPRRCARLVAVAESGNGDVRALTEIAHRLQCAKRQQIVIAEQRLNTPAARARFR